MILHPKKGENGDRIVGGQDAVVGQFPWQVLWTNDFMIYCGGTIFNESTIITAAHCCKVCLFHLLKVMLQ